jgi:hypothetical protein
VLRHDQLLSVDEGPLTFQAWMDGPVSVDGFSSAMAEAWDLTDVAKPVRLTGLRMDGEGTARQAVFQATAGRRYGVFDPGHLPEFEVYRRVEPPVLAAVTNAVDYLVVTPSALMSAVQPLLEYRRSQGLRTRAVSMETVQDEFAGGRRVPAALLNLMQATRGWAVHPSCLLLVGDGTYDYRNFTGFTDNLLPPLQSLTPSGRFPTDTPLADTDGDGLWETAVGRVPVHSASQFADWLAKVIDYETRPPDAPSRLLLMADTPDDAGSFIADSEELRGVFEPGYAVDTLYNPDGLLDSMRMGVTNLLRREPVVWNYVGHGARDRLGNGYILSADVPRLVPTAVPPLLVAMTCGAGQFGIPGFDAIAEILALRRDGGAIAAWSPSGFSQNASARLLNQAFARALRAAGRQPRLGDVVRATLAGYAGLGGDPGLPGLYNVLGDPATRLRMSPAADPDSVLLVIERNDPESLRIRWTGGVPPFHLQRRDAIEPGVWSDVLATLGREVVIPSGGDSVFYRIAWGFPP